MQINPASAHALASFKWEDPLLIDEDRAEAERTFRDAAYAYAQDKLLSHVTGAFANEETDPDIFREMGARGLLGTNIPEKFGGIGSSSVFLRSGRTRT